MSIENKRTMTRLRTPEARVPFGPDDLLSLRPHPLTRYDMAAALYARAAVNLRRWKGAESDDPADIAAARRATAAHIMATEELSAAAKARN